MSTLAGGAEALADQLLSAKLSSVFGLMEKVRDVDQTFQAVGRYGGDTWYAERNKAGREELQAKAEDIRDAWTKVLDRIGGESEEERSDLRERAVRHARDRFQGVARRVIESVVPKAGSRFAAGDPRVLEAEAEKIGDELDASLEVWGAPTRMKTEWPEEVEPYRRKFEADHPDPRKCGFVMMRFGDGRLHTEIMKAIRQGLAARGLEALRADDKTYCEELLPNIRTYMHGCGFGIAVFERVTTNEFNPNVSLEVGYMMALDKPVLLLKDSTLPELHTDLVGRIYRPFDTQDAEGSIPKCLEGWLAEKGLGERVEGWSVTERDPQRGFLGWRR